MFRNVLDPGTTGSFSQRWSTNNSGWVWDIDSCLIATGLAWPPWVGATFCIYRQWGFGIFTRQVLLHLQSNSSCMHPDGIDTRCAFCATMVRPGTFNFLYSRFPLKTAWASPLGERHHGSTGRHRKVLRRKLPLFLKAALLPPWDMGGDRGESGLRCSHLCRKKEGCAFVFVKQCFLVCGFHGFRLRRCFYFSDFCVSRTRSMFKSEFGVCVCASRDKWRVHFTLCVF